MAILTLTLTVNQAIALRDAVNNEAVGLRTNRMTDVVMSEKKFLESDISEGRRNRYFALRDMENTLDEFISKQP